MVESRPRLSQRDLSLVCILTHTSRLEKLCQSKSTSGIRVSEALIPHHASDGDFLTFLLRIVVFNMKFDPFEL